MGIAAYISDHIPQQSLLFSKLRKASIGTNSQPVIWTEELKKSLEIVHKRLDKLMKISPVDPDRDIFGVFDSSYLCNAAFFYQKNDSGQKRWIKIFSRRRSDIDNKFRPSS